MTTTNGIKEGDMVTIEAKGTKVTGKVISACNYGTDGGWYIELGGASVPGNYSYWKQGYDGGNITAINGQPVCLHPTH